MKTEQNKPQPWIGAEGRCKFCNIDIELEAEDVPSKELYGYVFIFRWEIPCPYCSHITQVSKHI